MAREFCPTGPQGCGLIEDDSPVCKKDCWHKDDKEIEPFEAMVFGKLVLVVGTNADGYYLQDGSSVHPSQVQRV